MSKPGSPDRVAEQAAPRRELTLFDSTCIIMGIIIGIPIAYLMPMTAVPQRDI